MPREQFQNLTEPMYYILISLIEERCGVDIMASVEEISKGRVKVGPGTLYALLGRFEKEGIIRETEVVGRKRSYIITNKGLEILKDEYNRLILLVEDGKSFLGGYNNGISK
ncbi:PadR family transcriptional regulator [Clostridium tertium]|jgi:DNA-binding PadR family transcriptional regulator|uniref:PadR family transcriptional regulator n=1 Tax=Clostridium TaxID=1485 RepID=UPI000BE2AFC6|nr:MULTISPECIES: PadR family transcriptional regulator [Clostridium]MBU6134744.1 PadR family transcriptional regulator [Clostridium tertium]MDB1940907.1 PadR family transcriptional regulator [Clostridium tertium]MDB1948180.1 PadR family transcriptional regulator [Clostridium tertium]MDB1953336.1 PadR family transcriptional regulator [Clostridium tertium]MDB1959592.1 PadR family transcriptional regulator [Clostridium tertium]